MIEGMKYGYARVSKVGKSVDAEVRRLTKGTNPLRGRHDLPTAVSRRTVEQSVSVQGPRVVVKAAKQQKDADLTGSGFELCVIPIAQFRITSKEQCRTHSGRLRRIVVFRQFCAGRST